MAELDEAAIFNAARSIADAAEREAYLRAACGNNLQAYESIATLLRAYEAEPAFLETPPAGLGLRPDTVLLSEGPGSVIGRYKLLERIGEGGFAVVYLAEQTESLRRQVALKIIRLGMDTRQVIARFEAERQALALMDHPGIAKVYDAGATETGRPYFVMQLIRGIPITDYCDRNRLSTAARLRLFVDVCRAVQHAHQKGIIHRDIKPSNVLVALHDGRPVAKVIDFGIAKAVRQRLTEKTLYTSYRQIIGTPQYMSPEQAEFSDLDVDTRSDIYSLGVLLYELLTSTTPLTHDDLERMGYDDICHTIRHIEPPTPSRRLSTLGDAADTAAQNRQLDSASLRKLLRGDLDWIVMKALEKDRTRRYVTAEGFANDIERHMAHEPVQARPPTAAYQLQKFVRKYRGPVAAGATILAILIVALVLAVVGLIRINAERDRAEKNLALTKRLVRDVLAPGSVRLKPVTDDDEVQQAKAEMVEQAIRFVEEALKQDPNDRDTRLELARLYDQLGDMAFWRGEMREAESRRAVAILNELVAESPHKAVYLHELCRALMHLNRLLGNELRITEARQVCRDWLAVAEQLVREVPNDLKYQKALYDAHQGMAHTSEDIGELVEAEKHHREAVKDKQTPSAHYAFADYLMTVNRSGEAEIVLDEGLRIFKQRQTINAFDRLYQDYWLAEFPRGHARVYYHRGELELAERSLKQSINGHEDSIREISRPWYRFLSLGWSYHHLSQVYILKGQLNEAQAAAQQCLTAWTSNTQLRPRRDAALGHFYLGQLLHRNGSRDKARSHFKRAIDESAMISRERPDELFAQKWRILFLTDCPEQNFREPQLAVELATRLITDSNGPLWRLLALSQYRSGAWTDAQKSLQKSMQLLGGGDALDWLLLAMIHWQLGEYDKASEVYRRAQDAISSGQPILYGDIGVLGFKRLAAEAASLVGNGPPQATIPSTSSESAN